MFGNFTEWGRTSSDGPKLKIDGKWVFPNRTCNLDGIQPGSRVEFETHLGGSKGTLVILDRIRPAPQDASYGPNQSGQQVGARNAANPPPAAKSPPWDDSGMRFISNVVGSAIAGGKCESPTDVRAWTLAAQEALTALSEREPGSDDLDDSAELEQMASQAQSRQKGPTDPPW